ncbi:MAG: hypothetical protein HY537_00340 [Deltaproteobacteria bacterium]|nr:hypothetical protein [Deltaproteobacteria bacterium]
MRTLFLISLVVSMLATLSARAVYIPGWERPVKQALLTEFDAMGHEVGIGLEKVLIMNKRDNFPRPTSFTFQEEKQVYCITYPCPRIKQTSTFMVANVISDRCGSTLYIAYETGFLSLKRRTLEVADHTTRICDDYRGYIWDVSLVGAGAKRQFGGNPGDVISIQ